MHYKQHEYFISKEFAPYTAADVQTCSGNSDPACAARMGISNPLDLDWDSSDYFHHTDTCIREPISLFSFSSSLFIIEFENLGLQKRAHIDSEFYTVLETIEEEPEDEGDHSPIELEGSQPSEIKNNNQRRNVPIDSDTRLVKPIPDSKFAKTFAMVEPAPKRIPPEFEDEDLYHAMSGHDRAQGMWIKPQRRPVAEMQKRDVVVDPDTKLVKAIPDSKFKKVFAMVEPPEPEPEEEVYVPEYEDEEIYNSMRGFKTAQSMWVKPKESSEKEKRGVSPIIIDGASSEKLPVIALVDKEESLSEKLPIITDEKDTKKSKILHGFEISPYIDDPELKVPSFGNIPELQFDLSFGLGLDLEFDDLEVHDLEKRGLDRALKFFHAPKEVLNAQLAANDEAAAYEAYLKAQQNPSGKAEAAPSEHNPNEDYVKKGGSVLIMNGRPLEVDGRPVNRNPIQKRSNGHGHGHARVPGLGLSRGPKRGGLKRGGGDKVTEMSSSSPPTTQSNSVVGVIENAVPRSLEEETVNVQKGRNFVLMNGRPMPANFAQKSTKPQKRSFVPEYMESRIHNEGAFGPEQHLRTPEEHLSSPEHRFRTPGHFRISGENFSYDEKNLRNPKQYSLVPMESFTITEQHLREPDEYLQYEDGFTTPEQYFRQPEDNFYPAEHKLTIPEPHFNAPEIYFYAPQERFYPSLLQEPHEQIYTLEGQHFTDKGAFELPQEFYAGEQLEVSEKYFYVPGERAYLPGEKEHIPSQREMWEIQKSSTGPITHAWRDSRASNEVYSGQHPSKADKKKFLHNYKGAN